MDKNDFEKIMYIKQYCEDIAATINRCNNSYDVFINDIDFYNSISMSLMQIGELTIKLSDNFKNATQTRISWNMIKGMRNHFAHGYATMDKSDIWATAINDIPDLLIFCIEIINENNEYGII